MKHKVRLTVIEKKLYPELQHQYCVDPDSGACSCYNVGDHRHFRSRQGLPQLRGEEQCVIRVVEKDTGGVPGAECDK